MDPNAGTSVIENRKRHLNRIIFGAETPIGKAFDVALLWIILLSVFAVMLESVEGIRADYGPILYFLEWLFTILFTLEYGLRIYCAPDRKAYIFSFFGMIDLLAVAPTYIDLFIGDAHYLMIVRVMRLLRVFRVLKLMRFLREAEVLKTALRSSRHKIIVFAGFVLSIVVIMGSLMFIIEGEENGFTSIPRSVYWAIVTLTTVGYGDMIPQTVLGQIISSFMMILGYGVIAVPTGIVSVELHHATQEHVMHRKCPGCLTTGHDMDATFCKHCGTIVKQPLTEPPANYQHPQPPTNMLRVYAYSGCDTCRKALKFLKENNVAHEVIAIRETPPSKKELRQMLAAHDGALRRLFNTSGQDYRKLGLSKSLPSMKESEALALLAGNGNLIKRPFVIGEGTALVGFKPDEWKSLA